MDESDHLTLVNAGDEEVVSQEEGGRGAPQGEKKEGVVARALSLSHTCGHTGRARTVLDWVFGLWRVCFPPCLVRPGRRLPVQGLSEGSLGYRERLPA